MFGCKIISTIVGLALGNLVAASAQPTLGFHQEVIEITEAADLLIIPLELSAVLSEPVEISFSTEDGTALAGEDYTATNGVLHVVAGPYPVSTNSAVVRIALLKDATREGNEIFFVHLRNPAGNLQLGSRTNLEVHILDNDQGIRFAQDEEVQSEPRTIEIEVLRGDDGSNDVTVEYSTVAGDALPGSDFQETNGTLIFHQGEASKVIQISIAENDLLETDETFSVILRNPTGGVLRNPNSRTIRILNGQPSLLSAVVLTNVPFLQPDSNKQALGIALQAQYAYMTYMKGLLVFDISDPARPLRIADTPFAGLSYGIALAANYAFIANGELLVVDIQQPSEPKVVAHPNVGSATDLTLSGHYAYLATYEGLAIVDVADPLQPVLLTNRPSGGTYTTGVAVQGNYAFVAAFDAGLQIFDVTDPAKPRSVGNAPMPGIARNLAVSGDYAYLTGGTNLLEVVSIANPAQPKVLARLSGGNGNDTRSIFIAEPYAYVADYSMGLYVLNISQPSAPHLVASYNSRSFGVAARARNIFLADTWSGLTVLGIAPALDPGIPVAGGFQFLLKSLANRPVRIERSINFQDWELWSQLIPDREVTRISDFQPGEGFRFYRAGAE